MCSTSVTFKQHRKARKFCGKKIARAWGGKASTEANKADPKNLFTFKFVVLLYCLLVLVSCTRSDCIYSVSMIKEVF